MVQQVQHKADRENSDFEVEYRIVRPDGSIRYLRTVGHRVTKDQGDVEFIGMTVDLTERKQAEERLQRFQAEFAHMTRLSTMGELVASIAHEINQPLGAIINNSNAGLRLLGQRHSREDLRGVLSDLVKDANRASMIIERVRALTKKSVPEKKELSLRQIIDDVLALSRGVLLERRIKVRMNIGRNLPRVVGDRVQLQQVLLNLVMNAADAMNNTSDDRRELTITTALTHLGGRAALLIAVKDLGRGFDPGDAEKLFDAFYSTKPEGMGMGLRISRSIIESHGGRLSAVSHEGSGATFSCVLPAE